MSTSICQVQPSGLTAGAVQELTLQAHRHDARTLALLEAPIAPTLVKLAAPNILVNIAQSSIGLIETYFVGKLGIDALAGLALVFPVVMLTQMMSAGAVGGGISSAIARALGGRRRRDADDLAVHSLAVGILFGLTFTVSMLLAGPWLYTTLGGRGASLSAALTYSNVIFSGAILIWIFNSLASVIRGTGNMHVPALVTCGGVGGGWLVLRSTGDLSSVFVALSVGLVAFGLINAAALATGAITAGKHSRKGTTLWFRNSASDSNPR